jgi:alanyl-tRNA synthetase
MDGIIVYNYNCCTSQDELRKAKKKMGEQNIQKAVKSAMDAAEAALSGNKLFCVTHVDVGLDTTAVREAVIKVMDKKVLTLFIFALFLK